jgi:hypothetical protein
MGPRVAIKVYDSRWVREGAQIVWKSSAQGNIRREQVVTIQSRQYLKLPPEVQERLFRPGAYSEMWPQGPDSIQGRGPRNVRIAHIEDQLLAIANDKADRIQLIPARFDPALARADMLGQHVLAICEGSRSSTLEYFAGKFGTPDTSIYALDAKQVHDMVLGLRVKSVLPDPMAVLLTVAQNRFLLNSLHGRGFLNMRLTDQEAKEAAAIEPVQQVLTECIQARSCLLERRSRDEFYCAIHRALFLPPLLRESNLWARVLDGLKLFGIPPENLSAVTGFRLTMVQRPCFTTQLFPRTATTPGTFGFLLGDAANAFHFWPGRGLNSGLSSAISLAWCLAATRRGTYLRDADFVRHEGVMAMLQYRHKNRAWRQLVTTDAAGNAQAIKDQVAQGIVEGERGIYYKEADIGALMERLRQTRARLASRIGGLPDDVTLRAHLERLDGPQLHTLLVSGAWDTASVGGEEVDVEWLFDAPAALELSHGRVWLRCGGEGGGDGGWEAEFAGQPLEAGHDLLRRPVRQAINALGDAERVQFRPPVRVGSGAEEHDAGLAASACVEPLTAQRAGLLPDVGLQRGVDPAVGVGHDPVECLVRARRADQDGQPSLRRLRVRP